MKIKYLSVLLTLLFIGFVNQGQAQEGEGGDFWTEEGAESNTKKSSTTKTAPGVKPVQNSCTNRNVLREEVRLLIRPFKYNLSKTTTVTFKRHPQLMRVIIPIYTEQDHRLIFSTKGLPQEIGIKIYDKPKGEKKRKLLFTSNSGEPINTFELSKDIEVSYLFVEYSIPPTDAEDRSHTIRGCAVLMMGYLFLPDEEGEGTVDTGDGKKKK